MNAEYNAIIAEIDLAKQGRDGDVLRKAEQKLEEFNERYSLSIDKRPVPKTDYSELFKKFNPVGRSPE